MLFDPRNCMVQCDINDINFMVFALEIAPTHNAIRLSSGRVGTTQAVFPWGIDCQNGAGIFISKK